MITENFVRLIVGDYSLDGHEKTEQFYIKSNISNLEITECYNEACKKVGFDLIRNYCYNYGDAGLPKKIVEKLLDTFPEIKRYFDENDEIDDYYEEDFSLTCYPELWVNLYLLMVKNVNPNFEYEFLLETVDDIVIGGYALFY